MKTSSIGLLLGAGVTAVALGGVAVRAGWFRAGDASNGTAGVLGAPSASGASLTVEPGVAAPHAAPTPSSNPATLPDTVTGLMSEFANTSGVLDTGSARLTLWAAQHPTSLPELKALPLTSPALFRRDPENERGRQFCINGTIQEIRAERNLARRLSQDKEEPLVHEQLPASGSSAFMPDQAVTGDSSSLHGPEPTHSAEGHELMAPTSPFSTGDWEVKGAKVYFAVLVETLPKHAKVIRVEGQSAPQEPKPTVVEAIAIGDTGSLVDGDTARFCGVLTGVNEASSPSGTHVLQHRVVGAFDLTELQKSASPASPSRPPLHG